jgi:hypothetical protein
MTDDEFVAQLRAVAGLPDELVIGKESVRELARQEVSLIDRLVLALEDTRAGLRSLVYQVGAPVTITQASMVAAPRTLVSRQEPDGSVVLGFPLEKP